MGWRFFVGRWCLFSLEVDPTEVTVKLDDESVECEDDDFTEITGGSGGIFERDGNPPNPMGEEPWYDDRFGFGNG